MAEVQSLENLSNAELRLKCIEYGLPNVPITDSSRKILLKRLRDTMTAKDNVPKSGNRRETIHGSKTTPPTETISEPLQTQGTKSRRTIAATAPAHNKDETSNTGPTSIPVSTRRRSVQKETENPKSLKAAPKAIPTIVLEDDEDVDLVNAVENAEKESTSSVPIETISSRRKSRSVSVSKVTEVDAAPKKRPMTPLVEEKTENVKNSTNKPKDIPTVAVSNNNAASQKSFQPTISSFQTTFTQPPIKSPVDMTGNWYSVYDQKQTIPSSQPVPKSGFDTTTSRYSIQSSTSSVYTSPIMRYSVGGVSSSLSSYRSKYTAADILNEQSDTDINQDDGAKSPFLSDFVRTLERSKSVGRSTGVNSGHYKKHSGINYEQVRGRRIQNEVSFAELVRGLNRRYNFKTIIVGLALLSLFIFIYVRLYSS